MTRLDDAKVYDLTWSEDEDGTVYAEGAKSYEIDNDNEIAIFQGKKCVEIRKAVDLPHAISIIAAHEASASYNARRGHNHHGKKVNERGWLL